MILLIDGSNTIFEFKDDEFIDEWWYENTACIDFNRLESAYQRYLEVWEKANYFLAEKLDTFEKFQKRINDFFTRKEKNIYCDKDAISHTSTISVDDRYHQILLNRKREKKKNVGVQLNLNFDL